ncbi:MAG TPA: hypothetical protein VFA07_19355 [Chthonomonadaceae bacterium]|nr:hypothetical protein [Chthonomonadaceae bacterium]
MTTPLEMEKQRGMEAAEVPFGERTIIGWQGVRCVLPPGWNVTGFSLDRDSGYLRVDAPGNSTMTVQIRWTNAATANPGSPSLYALLAQRLGKRQRQQKAPVQKPDLKANLEKILKETAKQARRGKASFESTVKPEKTEGEHGERSAINFSWSGGGRGQGKIWYCETCHRIIVAQVVGLAKDQAAIATVASQLFASLHDHAEGEHDLWALYDLQVEIPQDFRLETQDLRAGYLNLTFARGGEKIIVDRWGLANVALKKFTVREWFTRHARLSLKRLAVEEDESPQGHAVTHAVGRFSLLDRLRVLRETRGSLRRFPTLYEGGAWECAESNKIYMVQVLHSRRTPGLWQEVMQRCVCH